MSVSFDGVGQVCATFLGAKIAEGHVVKLTASGTVGECSSGDAFCGVALCSKDDACSVQVCGFVTVSYSGDAPAVGWTALTADGEGGVKTVPAASGQDGTTTAAAGLKLPVVDVDTTAKIVTILL